MAKKRSKKVDRDLKGIPCPECSYRHSRVIDTRPFASGKIIRLRGQGVPQLHGRGRGDLLVRILVETPTSLTDSEKDLLRQLAELRGEELTETEGGWLGRLRSAFS